MALVVPFSGHTMKSLLLWIIALHSSEALIFVMGKSFYWEKKLQTANLLFIFSRWDTHSHRLADFTYENNTTWEIFPG
jgi:hypothetical protein